MFARSGSHDSYQPTTVFHWLIEISVPKLTAPPQAGTAKRTVFTEYRTLFRSQFDPSPRRHIPAPVYPAIVRFPADNSLNPASHRPHKTHPQPGRAAARPHHRAGRTPNTGTDAIVAALWPALWLHCGRIARPARTNTLHTPLKASRSVDAFRAIAAHPPRRHDSRPPNKLAPTPPTPPTPSSAKPP